MKKGKSIFIILLLGILILGFAAGDVFFLYQGKKSSQIEYAEKKTEQENNHKQEKETEKMTYTSSLEGFGVGKVSTSNTKSKNENQNDYILKDSDSKYYTVEDLKGLTRTEVQLARNEIYARHGRKFTTDEIREYFEAKSWYRGVVDDVDDSELNKYEIANRDMIQKYEKSKGWN